MLRFFRGRKAGPQASSQPRLPAGHRIYAIGDIHGHVDALMRLEAAIEADRLARPATRVTTIYLGDYIDRGPDSCGVIEHLVRKAGTSQDCFFLKGNHEATLLAFLETPKVIEDWRRFGGLETLCSYGVDVSRLMRGEGAAEARSALLEAMPAAHVKFLNGLESMIVIGGYCFVHAGVRPGIPLARQTDESLLWIRREFLDHRGAFEKIVVHGHTPVEAPQNLPNRIAVDTGVYLTGRLTAAVLEGDRVGFLMSDQTGMRER